MAAPELIAGTGAAKRYVGSMNAIDERARDGVRGHESQYGQSQQILATQSTDAQASPNGSLPASHGVKA